jgi:hypothetical protein
MHRWILLLLSVLVTLLCVGCASQIAPTASPAAQVTAQPLPDDLLQRVQMEGWKPAEATLFYDAKTLFNYMNGEAELYFTFNFARLAMQQYQAAGKAPLAIELYEVAAPEDAYGLFTYYRGGEPADIGLGGDRETGHRLAFWQNRFYVRVFAMQDKLDDRVLTAFAEKLLALLPAGGEVPALANRLPAPGLQKESIKFFHDKMAQDNVIWLDAENILNLNRETDAVLADYRRGASDLQLLVVEYVDAGAASAAAKKTREAKLADLVSVEQSGKYLVAVVGVAGAEAKSLANEAKSVFR